MGIRELKELIETLWNVNSFLGVEESQKISELIETLWNVNNHVVGKGVIKELRINRNIVECKFYRLRLNIRNDLELIETLWNVNYMDW